MTNYQKPSSDADRLALLKKAHNTVTNGADRDPYLSAQTLARIQAQIGSFDAAIHAVARAKAQRSIAVTSAEEAVREVSYLVQEARRGLRLSVSHGKMVVGVLSYYRIPADGRLFQPKRREDWLKLADMLLSGDVEAQAAGFPGLANGAALAAARDTLKAAEEAVSVGKNMLAMAQEQNQVQRVAADELISDLTRELRFNLARLPIARRREVMRTHGVRFQSSDEAMVEAVLV